MKPGMRGEESPLPAGSVSPEPIAIVGIGCRFPGAPRLDEFWQLLRDGGDAITDIPADRFDVEAFYDPRAGVAGKTRCRQGGLLADVAGFDAAFFGIAPREAMGLDPQHRLLLEAGWEAVEDAGEVAGRLAGTATGVFIGENNSDYLDLLMASDPSRIDSVYSITGGARSFASGQVSYALDLRGPSLTVDTACSSSLLAVHLACQSIWRGESVMALAGGANLVLLPHVTIGFSQAGMAAGDGRCKAFAAGGDGYVRSDGVGVVLLKPLGAALADGNPVYAVILGTGAGNDGRSSGLAMSPGQAGQECALRAAYAQAGADPALVQYVEAHGTGTAAGDPVEVAALAAVLGAGRDLARPCVIGSVKTNIGHGEAAAGIAGLIKAALCLQYRQIPASLHSAELNPAIDWDSVPFVVPQTLMPWPAGERALAGVSSFGISGTNVHVVLEAAPGQAGPAAAIAAPEAAPRAMLLPVSARSPGALGDLAIAYAGLLSGAAQGRGPAFADICYTAGVRRTHHDHRHAVVARSAAEAAGQLDAFAEEAASAGASAGLGAAGGRGKVVFVFSGQGGQWPGMGQRLVTGEPVFGAAVAQCAEAMAPYLDWSLAGLIAAGPQDAGWQLIDRTQPALFAVQVALAQLWRSWGVVPDAVIGHSMGEVAAAYVAGALSLADAARVICCRSALLRQLAGQGAMAMVGLPADQAREELGGYAGRVCVAACNSPAATVVSGEAAAVADLLAGLESRGVFCRQVKVDVASHSPQVDGVLEELLAGLAGVSPRPGTVPMYSTVTGALIDGTALDAAYWARNVREPVLFVSAVERAAGDGYGVFVEISPHPVLAGGVTETCRDRWPGAAVLASMRRDEDERMVLLESLAGLYRLGAPVDWAALYPGGGQCVRLPGYRWQREQIWAEYADRWKTGQGGDGAAAPRRRGDGMLAHPLLGTRLRSASRPELHVFQTVLGPQQMSYLNDHRVQGSVVFPGAGYLEMALAAAGEVLGAAGAELSDVSFSRALVLTAGKLPVLRLELLAEGTDRAAFSVFSLAGPGGDDDPVLHASGMVWLGAGEAGVGEAAGPDGIGDRCGEVVGQAAHYEALRQTGLALGPAFQGVEEVWRGDGEALGRIALPAQLAAEAGRYLIHPAVLDACLQVGMAALGGEGTDLADAGTFVPVAVRRLCLAGRPGPALYSQVRLTPAGDQADRRVCDVTVTDESGRLVLSVQELVVARIDGGAGTGQDVGEWMYSLDWEPAEASPEPGPAGPGERWVVFCDDRGVGSGVVTALEAAGAACVQVSHGSSSRQVSPAAYQLDPADGGAWRQLLAQVAGAGPVTGIVHLWSLDVPEPAALTADGLAAGQALSCTGVMHLIQALAGAGTPPPRRLALVTAGAQAAGRGPGLVSAVQAPLWGMGRAIGMEQPELDCILVDLSPGGDPAEAGALCRELRADRGEDQVALRGTGRYAARLVPAGGLEAGAQAAAAGPARVSVPAGQPVTLTSPTPGILDNLQWTPARRRPPGPGEVEIAVCAAGMNFRDIFIALGVDVGQARQFDPGSECSGRVVALGEGVTGVKAGDEVTGFADYCFSSYVTTQACLLVPKPKEWSFEEAATVPIAYMTAYYALVVQARLAAGERVLIHAAAGGVGLAAVRIAQCLGAEVYATAGSPAKRAFLQSAGVRHVLDSRSAAFADEILALTDGQGVDIVLNSLGGAMMERSLDSLANFGRFVEIGKRDLYEHNRRLGLHHFQRSMSFFAVDLKRMIDERPAVAGTVLREVIGFINEHDLPLLPARAYAPGEVIEAFRYMAQAQHIGKLVIALEGAAVPVAPLAREAAGFCADASYLITGGLGGLGIAVAGWMAEHGAGHLVLTGRREASAAASEAIAAIQARGVNVVVAPADITDEEQVRGVLAMITGKLPPLRGIIHAAGVLDDGIVARLTEQRLLAVLAPKVLGAWHLHRNTAAAPLDFFVLFSSATGLLGSPGQASYCAANTFLDALAELRRSQGRPALSIAWGAWARVGLAAQRDERGKRLATRGLASMTPGQGLEALGRVLGLAAARVAVVPFDYQRWCQFYPAARTARIFGRLPHPDEAAGAPAPASAVGQVIRSAGPGERRQLIESYLSERGARILGFTGGYLDLHKNLQRLGLDSLMAVELRNAIEADIQLALPVMSLLQGVSIAELAQLVDAQLLGAADPVALSQPGVDHLSDREVEDLLGYLAPEFPTEMTGR